MIKNIREEDGGGGLTVRDEATFGMSRVIFSTMARGERSQSQDTRRQEKKWQELPSRHLIRRYLGDILLHENYQAHKNYHAHQKAGTNHELARNR